MQKNIDRCHKDETSLVVDEGHQKNIEELERVIARIEEVLSCDEDAIHDDRITI